MAGTGLRSNRCVFWLSFLLFFIAFVLFFVSYTGNVWYSTPYDSMAYPPDSPYEPVTMGLFWMCVRGHCNYDLRVDYMVVKYLPYKPIQDAFQNYRTACMAIESIAAAFVIASLALNLIVLADFKFSRIMGFVAAGTEVVAAIVALIGLILFAAKFRGPTKTLPYGWCFWLMVAAIIILFIDSAITAFLSAVKVVTVYRKKNAGLTQPLASGF